MYKNQIYISSVSHNEIDALLHLHLHIVFNNRVGIFHKFNHKFAGNFTQDNTIIVKC